MSKTSRSVFFLFLHVFILLAAASTSGLSFDMSPITNSDGGSFNYSGVCVSLDGGSFDYSGDCVSLDGGIQLTQDVGGMGSQVTYTNLLYLWDKASGNLTDFSTHFSFVIITNSSNIYADGLAFFLAPPDSTFKNLTVGGGLGLGNNTSSSSPSDNFVAVEFDTFLNTFDPLDYGSVSSSVPHVGIDINNVTSVNTTRWNNRIPSGPENDAWISYNAASKMLTVEFTGKNGSITQHGCLSYEVDLKDILPEYVAVGFSATTGLWYEQHIIKSWNFSSTLEPNNQSSNEQPIPSPEPESQNKKGLISGLSAGLTLLILAPAFAFYVIWKKKKRYNGLDEEHLSDSSIDNEFEESTGPRKFSYNELALATDNFAEEHKLGEGGFGCVYRGFLAAINTYIAVKRVSKESKQGRKEYAAEVKIISQLRHVNLVQLLGWCHQRAELLLVYEFMPGKSLDSHLFKVNSLLTWEMRYRIAQGLASALLYLHEELRQYVVHRDIKASNIMLDANFNAKLGDFGLARLVDHDKDSQTTVPAGTIGYMAPEYPVTGKASKETDIYSFGIVLLEIACGRRPVDHRNPLDRVVLVEWVWSLYGGGQLLDAADPKLDSSEYDVSKIEHLMVVGLWCVHPDSGQRPSIRQVMNVLNSEAPLPSLPLAMPKAMYGDTPRLMAATGSLNAYSGDGGTDSVVYAQCSTSSNLTTSSAGSTSEILPK